MAEYTRPESKESLSSQESCPSGRSAASEEVKIKVDSREIIDIDSILRPRCIVWTPIPIITWLLPFIGHVGICTSEGIVHDFAGSYSIGIDEFAFGPPYKFVRLDADEAKGEDYDRAIVAADTEFRKRAHLLCW